jgi:hypothetical protein
MVQIARATTFISRADSGRSEPPMCLAEMDGQIIEAFLKIPGLHDALSTESLVCELMAGQLATDLGLPCAQPLVVEITSDFVSSLDHDTELQNTFLLAPNEAFGSKNLGPQWRTWSRGAKTPIVSLPTVTDIYVFDTLIENSDRGIRNPNLLKKGDDLAIMDHEEAFSNGRRSTLARRGSRLPWHAGGITNHIAGDLQHVLWHRLKPANAVDFSSSLAKWEALPESAFLEYAARVPASWGQESALNIAEYLVSACQNLAAFQVELDRVFAGSS